MRSIPTMTPSNVAALDLPGAGNAEHLFAIAFPGGQLNIQFQRGPRTEAESTAGVLDDDLLAVLEARLAAFQAGDYACAENAEALAGIQAARAALGRRVARRLAAGTLGTHEKD